MTSIQPSEDRAAGVDLVITEVARHLGTLQPEEVAVVCGSVTAWESAHPDVGLPSAQVQALSQALGRFRSGPCRFCHLGLVDHAIDLAPEGIEVWCTADQRGRPLALWLGAGEQKTDSAAAGVVATLLWVGIPLLSLGMLGWAMPAVAAVLKRRVSWAIAAAVLLALVVVGWWVTPLDLNESDPLADALLLVTWLGSAVYGATQIRPWLAARAAPRQ